MATIKEQMFGDIFTGQAHVSLRQQKSGKFVVRRALPAGMDLYPDGYWFDTLAAAEEKYAAVCLGVQKMFCKGAS